MKKGFILICGACLTLCVSCGGSSDDDSSGGAGGAGGTKASTSVQFEDLFPADNQVSGWVEDTESGASGVEIAKTDQQAVDLIDGSADPFIEHGFAQFGREYYKKSDSKLELQVWQMDSAKVAGELYTDLTTKNAVYLSIQWNDVAIGEQGRIANTGASWWVNARKGAYYVEAKINPATDDTKSDVQDFAKKVISKL
jgi:hypothetical protein